MGCDIRVHREDYVDGKWISPAELTLNEEDTEDMDKNWYELSSELTVHRNYALFGLLAEVRSLYLKDLCHIAKGLPDDVSKEVKTIFDQWGYDAHTPSYHTLSELKQMLIGVNGRNLLNPFSEGVDWITEALKDIIEQFDSVDNDENHRIVFWFDN